MEDGPFPLAQGRLVCESRVALARWSRKSSILFTVLLSGFTSLARVYRSLTSHRCEVRLVTS